MCKERPIYFVCPDKKIPVGGVKQIYRQVEILRKNGVNAFVVHRKIGFKANWFENHVPIKYFPSIFHKIDKQRKTKPFYKVKYFFKGIFMNKNTPELDSILVFPETLVTHIPPQLFVQEKVIFNQNCYYTFNEYKEGKTNYEIYQDKKTLLTIVVSQDSKDYLEYKFDDLSVVRISLGISEKFCYNEEKKKQIAFMPRKLPTDLLQLRLLLQDKKIFNDWNWVAIDNKTECEVAEILKESAIYLSTNHIEGFGLPPAEAMACGCYVIGYTGNGGKEYFKKEFSSTVESGNVLDFAREIEYIVEAYNHNSIEIKNKGKLASCFIRENYNVHIEENDVMNIWQRLIGVSN